MSCTWWCYSYLKIELVSMSNFHKHSGHPDNAYITLSFILLPVRSGGAGDGWGCGGRTVVAGHAAIAGVVCGAHCVTPVAGRARQALVQVRRAVFVVVRILGTHLDRLVKLAVVPRVTELGDDSALWADEAAGAFVTFRLTLGAKFVDDRSWGASLLNSCSCDWMNEWMNIKYF